MLIYGHRGAPAVTPENTLLAFQAALDAGVDGIEFDVQATADGIPVILHDRMLDRTTNGTGPVDRISLADLRLLDAGRGERVPTLAETLELVGDRVHLDIELKQAGIERQVLAGLARHPSVRWAISSFDWTSLARCRAISNDAELWLLADHASDAMLATAARLGATAISLRAAALTPDVAKTLQQAGLRVVVWTVNDPVAARTAQSLGAAGLCTDDPATILQALRAH